MSETYCMSNSDTVRSKIKGDESSYFETEIPSTVQAPFTDTVNVGLQHFAVLNINEATEDFEVFGRVTFRIV